MSDLIFIATRPMVFVPILTLLLLLSLIWFKASNNKLKVSAVWVGSYLAVCGGLVSVAYVQYLSGCGFSLRDCYSDAVPDWLWIAKLMAALVYWIWIACAAFSVIRRALSLSDKAARKIAVVAFAVLVIGMVGFILYLRSF